MTDSVGLPRGWTDAEISTLGEVVTGFTPSTARSEFYGGSIPFVRPQELKGLPVAATETTLTELGAEATRVVPENSVLVGCIGTLGKTGITAAPAAFNQQINAIVPGIACIPKWLFYGTQSPSFQRQMAANASATTVAIINKGRFSLLRLPVAPLPEQKRIVEAIESYLTRLDNAVALLERVEENLKRYRASVLKAAVEGRLVPTEAELARREGRDLPAPRPGTYYVYAIACEGGSNYIGQTDNIPRRWQEHVEGKGASWTRRHRPLRLVHWEEYGSREEAVEREKHLKTGFGRKWLRREIAAGRTRQAGYEPASELLKRILAERKARWIEDAAEKARAKAEEKARRAGQPWTARDNAATLEKERAKATKQYKEPAAPDLSALRAQAGTTGLPDLPEGWCWATVAQLSSGTRPCAYGVLVPGPDVDDGVELIRVGDVVDGEVKRKALKRIAPVVADRFPRTYLSGGEVLITLVGTIGRTAVVPESLAGANVARAVGVIVPSQQLGAHWIETWFRNPARAQIMSSKAHEVARKTLNLEDVRDAVVAIPPAAERDRIVADLQRVDQVRKHAAEEVRAVRRRSARLRQSILKWAFEGKLVEQDSNDEPASVLLERIRTMRATPWPRRHAS